MKSIYTSALFSCLLFTNILSAQLAGDYDYSFGDNGKVETDINQTSDKAETMLIQPDGKIVVAGLWSPTTQLDEQIGVVRYNSNGTPDSTFGTYGKRMVTHADIGMYGNIELNDMKLQSDGKILLTGGLINYTDFSWNFFLLRLNADGVFDSTFSHDGIDTTTFGGFDDIAYSMALQPDGKIVAAGQAGTYPSRYAVIIRYNTDASVDSTFGTNGVVNAGLGNGRYVGIQPDGKILLTSYSLDFSENFIQRYDSLGVIDPAFTPLPPPFFRDTTGSYVHTMNLQGDGKILLGGSVGGFESDFALVRLETDGTIDSAFGVDGLVVTPIPGAQAIYSLATQTDGKIVATGYVFDTANREVHMVIRYLSDGTVDSSFHYDGLHQEIAGGYFGDIKVQADGKIVAAGFTSYVDSSLNVYRDYLVARFLGVADSICTNTLTQQPADVSIHPDSAIWFAVSATNPYAVFQWQVNDGSGWQNINNGAQFSGANSNLLQVDSVTPANNQYRFRCIITYGISCADTSVSATLSVIISGVSPVPDSNPGIRIFPNPGKGFINITADASIISLRVTNVAGQLVYESRPNRSTTGLFIFDSGIYFITLTTPDGESSTRRLVVCK